MEISEGLTFDDVLLVPAASDVVPEGVEGQVPYKGPVGNVLHQMMGGLRASMGYTGVRYLEEMSSKCEFIKISNSSLEESHVHNVQVTREAPNYRGE